MGRVIIRIIYTLVVLKSNVIISSGKNMSRSSTDSIALGLQCRDSDIATV